MAAPAFTKFDARAFLENEMRRGTTAKPAKGAKALEPKTSRSLATFAALAGDRAEIQKFKPVPDTWTDAQDERAAIVEYDSAVPRAWAEALARLNPDKPPRHVPPQRWLRFIDDCGRFLDCGWADKAAALGWGPLDLFGCDRKRPYYVSPRGLLWEVNGGTIVALSRDLAIIEIEGGDRRAYKREPVEVGRVALAWELM